MSNIRANSEEGKKVTRFLITGIDQLNRKAVSGAGRATIAFIKKEIRRKYNIRLTDLNNVISAKAGNQVYEIKIETRALSAVLFKPREIRNDSSVYSVRNKKGKQARMEVVKAKLQKRFKGSTTGVTIEYEKGEREFVQPGGRKHKGFIAKTPGRGIQVFYRRDGDRDKIFTFYKGSVAGLVSSAVSLEQIEDIFRVEYLSELERLLPYLGTSHE